MLLLMLYSKSLNETGQYFMFRWGKFELRRSLVNSVKATYLNLVNSLKQLIFETFLSFVVA